MTLTERSLAVFRVLFSSRLFLVPNRSGAFNTVQGTDHTETGSIFVFHFLQKFLYDLSRRNGRNINLELAMNDMGQSILTLEGNTLSPAYKLAGYG